ILLLFMLFVMSVGQLASGLEEFSAMFGFSKAMSSCLGSDMYRSYLRQLAQANRYCRQQPLGSIPEPDPWLVFPIGTGNLRPTYARVNATYSSTDDTKASYSSVPTGLRPVPVKYQSLPTSVASALYGTHLIYDGTRGYIPPSRPVVVHGGVNAGVHSGVH
ncbi:unnamed protein product, partial [Meganyctiphanes norvegica]